jgi:hypothetical protein
VYFFNPGEAGWVDLPAYKQIGLFETDESILLGPRHLFQQISGSDISACPVSPAPAPSHADLVLTACPEEIHAAAILQVFGFIFLLIGSQIK